MKMNNKGFAITGILYTLLILFTLTLISVISVLNTRNKILEKASQKIEYKKSWNCINDNILRITAKKGKYIFVDNNNNECYTYLAENTLLEPNELTFTTSTCNLEKETLTLKGYCLEE